MCENYLKSRLKRKKIALEHRHLNQSPIEVPDRSPTAWKNEGAQIPTNPEIPVCAGGSTGRRLPAEGTKDGQHLPEEGTKVGLDLAFSLAALEQRLIRRESSSDSTQTAYVDTLLYLNFSLNHFCHHVWNQ